MQKLDNRRTAYAMLPVGAETPMYDGFPLPTEWLVISAAKQTYNGLTPGVRRIKNPILGNKAWPIVCGFSAPGFFRISENTRKRLISIYRFRKDHIRKGITPMFSRPIFSVPAAAPMGGA